MEWLIPLGHFSKGPVPLVSSSDCWRLQLGSPESRWNGGKQQHHYSISVTLFKAVCPCLCCCYSKSVCRSSRYSAARCRVLSGPPNSDQNSTAANEGRYLGFMSRVCVYVCLLLSIATRGLFAWPSAIQILSIRSDPELQNRCWTNRCWPPIAPLRGRKGSSWQWPRGRLWLIADKDRLQNKTGCLLCNA